MAIPAVGSKVHVEFDGTVINRKDDFLGVEDSEGIIHFVWCSNEGERIKQVYTVTGNPDPEGWPVQIGDIWVVPNENPLACNPEYVALNDDCDAGVVVTNVECSDDYYAGDLDQFFKKLNPKLVRRRG